MSLIAFDSAHPEYIPPDPPAIFPYYDGEYKWGNSMFPSAKYRYITVTGSADIDIIDYEEGCVYNPTTLRDWAEKRKAAHLDITVYTDRANFATVDSTLSGLSWNLFLSTLDGTCPTSYEGKACRAVQVANCTYFDVSVVFDTAWLL